MGTSVAEDSEVVDIHRTRKVKTKNGSKKPKGSLRRRMHHLFASPVHLFRRYVLRKRPKKCSKMDNDCISHPLDIEAVENAKQRNIPCYLLFLGLQQSGKSTTISKLFNGKRPSTNDSLLDPSIKVYRNLSVGDSIGLQVVDAPGLCGNEQQDTELVTALSSFLKQDLPNRIPTVTFIVARMDDDDIEFENKQSQFSQMLQALSHAEKDITDEKYSNLILLLTHSQKANDIPGRISIYQKEFAKVFPDMKYPIHVIAIDNIRYSKCCENMQKPEERSYHNIIFKGLKDFAKRRQEHSLNALVNWFTEESKRFSVPFQQEVVTLSECLSDLSEIGDENDFTSPQQCEPYFVMYHQTEQMKNRKSSKKHDVLNSQTQQQRKLVTCIPSGSQIMLADKSLVSIDKCLVGDKLLGLHNDSSVITGVRRGALDEVFSEYKSVGSIYCSKDPHDSTDESPTVSKFIYMYNNEKFELVSTSKANVPEKTSTDILYILEMDSPKSTFIVNGFPCFAHVSVPNQ